MGMYSHMLNQNVIAAHTNGTNDYSERQFDPEVQVKARVELTNKAKQAPNGEMVTVTAKVWVEPSQPFDAGDKIKYRDDEYQVVSRIDVPDGQGITRLVMLECMEWRNG